MKKTSIRRLERASARERLKARQLDDGQLAGVTGGFECQRDCERPPWPWQVSG